MCLLTHEDRVLPGGFAIHKIGTTAEYFEDCTHQVMGMGNVDEALRVLIHDGDPNLGLTIFSDGTPPPSSTEQ